MTYTLTPWAPVFPWYLEIPPLDFCELYINLKLRSLATIHLLTTLPDSSWIWSYVFSKVGLRRILGSSRWRLLGFMLCSWIQPCSRLSMTQSTVSTCCALFIPHGVRWAGLRAVRHALIQSAASSNQSTTRSFCPKLLREKLGLVDYFFQPVDYCGEISWFLISSLFAPILHDFHHSY